MQIHYWPITCFKVSWICKSRPICFRSQDFTIFLCNLFWLPDKFANFWLFSEKLDFSQPCQYWGKARGLVSRNQIFLGKAKGCLRDHFLKFIFFWPKVPKACFSTNLKFEFWIWSIKFISCCRIHCYELFKEYF